MGGKRVGGISEVERVNFRDLLEETLEEGTGPLEGPLEGARYGAFEGELRSKLRSREGGKDFLLDVTGIGIPERLLRRDTPSAERESRFGEAF